MLLVLNCQTVYCWQPCLSGCRSSSLEQSTGSRILIVITADFSLSFKSSSFSIVLPSPDFWLLDWHRYSRSCSNISLFRPLYLCLLTSLQRKPVHYSVDLRIQACRKSVPLKYGKLAAKYQWICEYCLQCNVKPLYSLTTTTIPLRYDTIFSIYSALKGWHGSELKPLHYVITRKKIMKKKLKAKNNTKSQNWLNWLK